MLAEIQYGPCNHAIQVLLTYYADSMHKYKVIGFGLRDQNYDFDFLMTLLMT